MPPADASAILKDETICIRCALCAERCPTGAITMERFHFKEVPDMPDRLEPEADPAARFPRPRRTRGPPAIAIFGSLLGMARLPKPRVLPEAGSRFRIGRPEEFPAGTRADDPGAQRARDRRRPAGIAAMSLVCTHLGCIVARVARGLSPAPATVRGSGRGRGRGRTGAARRCAGWRSRRRRRRPARRRRPRSATRHLLPRSERRTQR